MACVGEEYVVPFQNDYNSPYLINDCFEASMADRDGFICSILRIRIAERASPTFLALLRLCNRAHSSLWRLPHRPPDDCTSR